MPSGSWLRAADVATATLVACATFLVHDVGYVLSRPYWLDEAWVAATSRARLGLLPWLTQTTPLGWIALIRVVPYEGQRYRLVPLCFAAGAAVAAYLLGNHLRLVRIFGPALAAAGVLLLPAMLVRDDLKQYTTEAFATLILMVLVARTESHWSRRRLAALGASASLGLLFTNTTAFVGVAGMAALGLDVTLRRQWRRLAEVIGLGGAMVAAMSVIYLVVDARHKSSLVTGAFGSYYMPTGPRQALSFLHGRADAIAPYLGFHHPVLPLVLAGAGIVTMWVDDHRALALTTPFIIIMAAVASAYRAFPFLDLRTSTFWLAAVGALMGIGAAGIVTRLARLNRPLAAVALVGTVIAWSVMTWPYVRAHPLPNEDVASQVTYLNRHIRPGDVTIVDLGASYAFAYYERRFQPAFAPSPVIAIRWRPTFPHTPSVIAMSDRQATDVDSALRTAEGMVGRGATVWIVRSHLAAAPVEAAAWSQALAGLAVKSLDVGPEPLLRFQPGLDQAGVSAAQQQQGGV